MKYAIKIHSTMTGNNFYFVGNDEEEVKANASKAIKFFMNHCEDYSEVFEDYAYAKDMEYFEEVEEEIDKSDIKIVSVYSDRF